MTTSIAENYIDETIDTLQELQGEIYEDLQVKNVVTSTDIPDLDKMDPRLSDRIWRLNNLYSVINEDGQLVKFKLRPAQLELMENMHLKNIILKARQLGFTTFVCIFFLDFALFNSNKQLGIIAHTKEDAAVIFRKVKVAWDNFNPALKQFLGLTTDGDSKTEYIFSNGSVMRISTSLRSGTYQAVLITEFGKICARFPEKAEEIISGTLPAANKGLVFIESTAEGETGEYYDMVQKAILLEKEGRKPTQKEFKFFFFPWYRNPANNLVGHGLPIDNKSKEYFAMIEAQLGITLTQEQKNWYWVEKDTQKDLMKQEHPSTPDEAFFSAGNKLFSLEVIEAQKEHYCIQPIRVDRDFKFFRPFYRDHVYALGADVSEGKKRDSSTIVVIDFTTGEVVMTYKSDSVDPVLFAHEIKRAALEWGGCLAAPEVNSVGYTTCSTLLTIYGNVFTQMREGLMEDVPTNKVGWKTTGASKPRIMYELSESVGSGELKILDYEILQEARKFNKEDAVIMESKDDTTRHFDLLMACAIAWQMRIHATRGTVPFEERSRVEERRTRNLTRRGGSYR